MFGRILQQGVKDPAWPPRPRSLGARFRLAAEAAAGRATRRWRPTSALNVLGEVSPNDGDNNR